MDQVTELVTLTTFYEIATLLVLATVAGLVSLALRQPLIVAFLAVGILAGPAVLAVARSTAHIELLAELGVTILLFLVGLKLDLRLVRSLGPVALATGIGQVAFTSLVGFAICLALGLDAVSSAYIAIALTFSSTIIIVKLLTDKRETESLHGRIALGFLIVQDLVVVLALAVLSGIGVGAGGEAEADTGLGWWQRGLAALLFFALVMAMWRLGARLLTRIVQLPELLITFAVGWAALMAALGDLAGLGKEIGGLAAGLALASSPLRETVAGRLAAIREFLLIFFFIALGLHLELSTILDQVGSGIVLSLFVLIGNPIIVMIIMGTMGYRKRTGFLAGLTVAQISEFSFVFMAAGVTVGHVAGEAVGLVTLVGLVTIGASTYMIYYSHNLYRTLEPMLGVFERRNPWREPTDADAGAGPSAHADAVVLGLGRYGAALAARLVTRGWRVVGIDFDPEAVARARKLGLTAYAGDVTDPDLWHSFPIAQADWAVCAIPGLRPAPGLQDPRFAFLEGMHVGGRPCRWLAVTAHSDQEADDLMAAGADLILQPFKDAADQAADVLQSPAGSTRARNMLRDLDQQIEQSEPEVRSA